MSAPTVSQAPLTQTGGPLEAEAPRPTYPGIPRVDSATFNQPQALHNVTNGREVRGDEPLPKISTGPYGNRPTPDVIALGPTENPGIAAETVARNRFVDEFLEYAGVDPNDVVINPQAAALLKAAYQMWSEKK